MKLHGENTLIKPINLITFDTWPDKYIKKYH